ncbi:MAG: hypothetical protein LBV20_00565 [Treponema sp.]|jgi:hypothetical protein|nr:hypothetical protein [Treponema sp.]
MARMTEEEAFALDEKWTKSTPKIGPNGTGFLSKRNAIHAVTVDRPSSEYLYSQANAANKTPAEIISELVQKELAADL